MWFTGSYYHLCLQCTVSAEGETDCGHELSNIKKDILASYNNISNNMRGGDAMIPWLTFGFKGQVHKKTCIRSRLWMFTTEQSRQDVQNTIIYVKELYSLMEERAK